MFVFHTKDMKQEGRLSERISRLISQEIIAGKYQKGDKLPSEPELMSLYKVGRSTIREAIRDLVLSGVLKVQQGSGTTVIGMPDSEPLNKRLKRADFDEINAVRKLLEKEIVSLAIDHHTTGDLEEIERWLRRRRVAIEKESRAECMDADIGFHQAIASASGNRVLADLYQNFTTIIRDFFSQREPQGIANFALTHYLHEHLYQAIKGTKRDAAENVLQQILNNNY
jgi:DNA-binding FadR family transcriptional regulator